MNAASLPQDVRLIHAASNLAVRLHLHQRRKDGVTPYVAHLMRVPLVLSRVFGCQDPVILAAAMLHDAIEDTTADYDEIAQATSVEVAALVAVLTKDMRMPDEQRELAYDQQLAAGPWQARLIKLADVYDNLCDSVHSGAEVEIRDKVERALKLAGDSRELHLASGILRSLANPV